MTVCHLDFETRSTVDLPDTGVYVYVEDETTDVWCAAYAFDDGPVQLWAPGDPFPADLFDHIMAGGEIAAWNANFERVFWKTVMRRKYDWPVPDDDQFRCVMVEAYAMSLPGKLEQAAPALGLEIQKDMKGQRLMLQMSRPRKVKDDGTIIWWDDEDRKQRLYAYCRQDVVTERAVEKRLLRLSSAERQIYLLDQKINDRGVFVDAQLCLQAKKIATAASKALDSEMSRVTGGEVFRCSNVQSLINWLRKHDVNTDSVAKDALADLLIRNDLPLRCRRALELRKEAAKTSTKKIDALLRRRNRDGRMRGNLQYHGAGTGRWAGRGAQLQNLPRPSLKDIPTAIDALMTGDVETVEMLFGSPLSVVADCIRGMIAAQPGKKLWTRDFSNIEGRGVAWLAGEHWKLDAFRAFDRGEGPDLYLVAAANIYNVSIEDAKPFRQVGKVAELALGYQGGPGAFAKMAANYGLKVETAFGPVWESATATNREKALDAYDQRGRRSGMKKEAWLAAELIKLAWRDKHPNIVALWRGLEDAALQAVARPGFISVYGRIRYRKAGSFLWCCLPSGRTICYPFPRIREVEMPWLDEDGKPAVREAVVYKAVDQFTRKWGDKAFYGGLATENVTQAVARDIMAEAMVRVERAGYPVVLTVHDEIVCETPEDFGDPGEFTRLMTETPPWAASLPVAADGWDGQRYRK